MSLTAHDNQIWPYSLKVSPYRFQTLLFLSSPKMYSRCFWVALLLHMLMFLDVNIKKVLKTRSVNDDTGLRTEIIPNSSVSKWPSQGKKQSFAKSFASLKQYFRELRKTLCGVSCYNCGMCDVLSLHGPLGRQPINHTHIHYMHM